MRAGGVGVLAVAGDLEGLQVGDGDLRLVVEHLLEVRDEPAVVHGVAMEAAAELIVHAAAGHLAQGEQHHVERFLVLGARVVAQQEVMHGDARKLGRAAEAAEARIEGAAEDGEGAFERGRVERRAGAVGRHFHMLLAAARRRCARTRRSSRDRLRQACAIWVRMEPKPGWPQRFSGGK